MINQTTQQNPMLSPSQQPSPMQMMAQQESQQGNPQDLMQGMSMNIDDPRLNQLIDPIVQNIMSQGIPVEIISQMVNMLKFAIENPDSYGQVRQQLLNADAIDPEDMPEEFDAKYLTVLLIAFKVIENKMLASGGVGMKRGGLAKLAQKGRNGDTRLAHINPLEDKILRSYGGAGSINPNTGLPEYGFLSKAWKSVKGVVKEVAPIAIPVMMIALPGIGTAIGTALGASGIGATMLGGAVLGGGMSAVTGGNILQGAALGGLGGGLGTAVGSGVNSALGLGLGTTGQAVLGSALVGGAVGGATGTGVLKGAAIGSIGGAIGAGAGYAGTPTTGWEQGVQAAARGFGNALTVGYDPKTAGLSGLAAGATSGLTYSSPSEFGANYETALTGERPPENVLGVNTGLSTNPSLGAADIAGASQMPVISTPTSQGFDFMNTVPQTGDGSLGLSYQQGVAIPAYETPQVFDDYASQGMIDSGVANPSAYTPADVTASERLNMTQYSDGTWGAKPNVTTQNAQGLYGINTVNPTTGGLQFSPYAGQSYAYNPETGMVERGLPTEPSYMDRIQSALTGSEAQSPLASGTQASSGTPWGKYALYGGLGYTALTALNKGSVPQEVQPEVSKLPEAQQEYFYRPSVTWDWSKMQSDAAANNMTLSQYLARNWGDVTSGKYNNPISTATEIPAAARGGALSKIAHFAQGAGTGRSDEIDAKLSDGEYVIDAETVALLGDGSSKAGAEILDKLREEIRKQKGKALAKGKISPNAKSPLSYLKGVK